MRALVPLQGVNTFQKQREGGREKEMVGRKEGRKVKASVISVGIQSISGI